MYGKQFSQSTESCTPRTSIGQKKPQRDEKWRHSNFFPTPPAGVKCMLHYLIINVCVFWVPEWGIGEVRAARYYSTSGESCSAPHHKSAWESRAGRRRQKAPRPGNCVCEQDGRFNAAEDENEPAMDDRSWIFDTAHRLIHPRSRRGDNSPLNQSPDRQNFRAAKAVWCQTLTLAALFARALFFRGD